MHKIFALSILLVLLGKVEPLGQLLDYVSPPYRELKKVACISHDTKYTCDCGNSDENMILPRLNGHAFHISVSNCKYLTVPSYMLSDTQGLRSVTFKDVSNLILNENALAFPKYASSTPLIITFEDVQIEKIDSHAINGNIEEITFIGGSIATIRPFAFTTLKDHAILLKLDSLLIDRIEPQAFKKFSVEQLDISNCVITSNLPSKSFYELEALHLLKIHNVSFREVHSKAFTFNVVSKLIISNNKFQSVDGEWFDGKVKDNVLIRNNTFGVTSPIAFQAIDVHRDFSSSERLEMRFFNNSVKLINNIYPLEFSSQFQLNINQLQYENNFPCQMLEKREPKIAFFRIFSDSIYFRTNDDHYQSLSVSKIIDHDCRERSYLMYIIIGIVSIILVIIIILIVVGCIFTKKRERRKLDIVMPDTRTYKETQIVLQIENAGLLKTDL